MCMYPWLHVFTCGDLSVWNWTQVSSYQVIVSPFTNHSAILPAQAVLILRLQTVVSVLVCVGNLCVAGLFNVCSSS